MADPTPRQMKHFWDLVGQGLVNSENFQQYLEHPNSSPTAAIDPPEFKVFTTILLGAGPKTADEFCEVLEAADCRVSDWARDILAKPAFKAASEATEVDLVVATVRELGFPEGATYREICDQASKHGLELCPAEVGPQLRLQYLSQPMSEWLIIAMEPITDSGGVLDVFGVKHDDDGRLLDAHYGDPGCHWSPDRCFVFVRRK